MKPIIGVVMYQTSRSKGQELVAQRMVKWFNRLGYRAYLITSVYHDNSKVVDVGLGEYLYLENDGWSGVPTVRIDGYVAGWPPRRIMIKDFVNVLKRVVDDFGINSLITHSTLWNGPEEVAKFVTWRRLLRALGHDVGPIFYGHMSHYQPPDPLRYDESERAYRIAWNNLALQTIFKVADLILCVTLLEAEDMVRMGARPEQIYVFPGGIDDDEVSVMERAKGDFRSRFGIPKDVKLVSYLGTVEERKNPLAVVRVAKLLRDRKDAHFVIAGKPGDQWRDVVEEARGLENVTITGELSEEDKWLLIRESYVNLIMSRMEALGLTQLEFMYGGVPVVTSAVYGQRWLIRNWVDGIHVNGPDDVEGAAKAIRYLLDNPEKRDEMGRNARERARSFLMSRLVSDLATKIEHFISK